MEEWGMREEAGGKRGCQEVERCVRGGRWVQAGVGRRETAGRRWDAGVGPTLCHLLIPQHLREICASRLGYY
jgi:hypothetical protein